RTILGNMAITDGKTVWNANASSSFSAKSICELNNQVTIWTQFAHLQYYAKFNQQIFEIFLEKPQTWSL
ncbi:33481_t:CDS:1, partial [Gigaspora margarita]